MVVITVKTYQNARVHTITVKNKDFFWVKMKYVQDRHKEFKRCFKKRNMW